MQSSAWWQLGITGVRREGVIELTRCLAESAYQPSTAATLTYRIRLVTQSPGTGYARHPPLASGSDAPAFMPGSEAQPTGFRAPRPGFSAGRIADRVEVPFLNITTAMSGGALVSANDASQTAANIASPRQDGMVTLIRFRSPSREIEGRENSSINRSAV